MKISRIAVASLLAGLLSISIVACQSKEKQKQPAAEKPDHVVRVSVLPLQLVELTDTFTLPASLEAWEDLMLAAETSGAVWKINFQEGDHVKKGDVLLEIDPETVRSYLRRDKQNVAVLTKKLKRYRQLESDGLISQQELDNLENSVTAAQSALQATRLRLAKSFPKAPVSGIVDHLYIDRGEYVDPGKPLLRLVQVERLKVIADVPEKDVLFLQPGQKVEILSAAMTRQGAPPVIGTIESIAYSADKMTRTYRTKIALDNRTGKLRPGMIVRARFVRHQYEQVIAVPLFAVMDRDGTRVVFVDDNGVARKVEVVTGNSIGQQIIVRQGLSAGQSLIVKGQQLLTDGARIEVGEL